MVSLSFSANTHIFLFPLTIYVKSTKQKFLPLYLFFFFFLLFLFIIKDVPHPVNSKFSYLPCIPLPPQLSHQGLAPLIIFSSLHAPSQWHFKSFLMFKTNLTHTHNSFDSCFPLTTSLLLLVGCHSQLS